MGGPCQNEATRDSPAKSYGSGFDEADAFCPSCAQSIAACQHAGDILLINRHIESAVLAAPPLDCTSFEWEAPCAPRDFMRRDLGHFTLAEKGRSEITFLEANPGGG